MEHIEQQPTATGPADRFTGSVYISPICVGADPSRLRASLVRFTPAH
jgi:hypothetical protein